MQRLFLSVMFCLFFVLETIGATPQAEVVVFDFGGVIGNANAIPVMNFMSQNLHVDRAKGIAIFQDLQKATSNETSEKEFWKKYALNHGLDLPSNWDEQLDNVLRKAMTMVPGTIHVIEELEAKGYRLALLSNITEFQAKIIGKLGYYRFFNPVLLSYQLGVEKPASQAYKKMIKILDVDSSKILFIDDRKSNVKAAKKEGIDTILFKNSHQLRKALNKRGFNLGG